MKLKAIACILTAAALMTAPVFAESGSAEAMADTQNPIMNFIGRYAAGRASILIEADGSEDGKAFITWGSSAAEHSEWEMSGPFDPDTETLSYSDCVRKDIVFNEDGTIGSEDTVYENGTGTIVFADGAEMTLVWNDDMESMADDMVFEYIPPIEDESLSVPEGAESIPDIEEMAEDAEYAVSSSVDIEDGVLTVRLTDNGKAKEGFRWAFLGDGSVDDDEMVELVTESTEEDGYSYVGSFRAVQDGETYVRLIHTNGIYSDSYMDFNVKAEGGQITENTGGSCAFGVNAPEFYEAFLEGEWREEENEALSLAFSLTESGEIQAVIEDGNGEILNTEVYYDAMYESMVYDGGALIPDIRSENPEDAGILWRNDSDEADAVHRFVKTPEPAAGADAAAQEIVRVEAEEYPQLLVNGLTKEECEYVLAEMPENLAGDADGAALTKLVEFVNTGYGMLDGSGSSGEDVSLGTYNRYAALVSDLQLTPDNIGEYTMGTHPVYEKDGEYYLPWYQIEAWPEAEVKITDTVRSGDKLYILYDYVKYIPMDDSTAGKADPVSLCAVLVPGTEDGGFRVSGIRTPDEEIEAIFAGLSVEK